MLTNIYIKLNIYLYKGIHLEIIVYNYLGLYCKS